MCELYELAGWEGGADELSGLGTGFWVLLFRGLKLYSTCIGLGQLVSGFASCPSWKDIGGRVEY